MKCPKCGAPAAMKNITCKITTATGLGTGGYLAATSGASAGAAVGTMLCPGVGTLAGGILGILLGAAAGGAIGHEVGKYIDESVLGMYQCKSCGFLWEA